MVSSPFMDHGLTYMFLIITLCWLCVCVCAQSCLTVYDLMDCNPPGSSVHGIFQARLLEQVATSSSRGSSQPRDKTLCLSLALADGFFITYPLGKLSYWLRIFLIILDTSQESLSSISEVLDFLAITPANIWQPFSLLLGSNSWRYLILLDFCILKEASILG